MTDLFDTSERLSALRVARAESLLADPWPKRDPIAARRDLERVKRAATCLRAGALGKNMAGMGSLWGYFPHAADVKVSGVSLRDKWNDPETLAEVARKTAAFCERHERGRVSRNRALQSLKAYNGHHVSNFRPVAARDIYLSTAGRGARIFDPCGGWGGRMMGALAAGCSRYCAVDAAEMTVDGLERLSSDLDPSGRALARHAAIEDFAVEAGGFDVAFTSPPYFDAERYSDDPEQSCVRYPSYQEWRDGFLFALCRKMVEAVAAGGFVVLNIADVRGLPLVDDADRILSDFGLDRLPRLRYVMSSIAGKGEKSEPVLVYRKKVRP